MKDTKGGVRYQKRDEEGEGEEISEEMSEFTLSKNELDELYRGHEAERDELHRSKRAKNAEIY